MLRSVVLSLGLLVATPALACPMADAAAYQAAVQQVEAASGTKVSLAVDGLASGGCSSKVVAALKSVDGVVEAAVDHQTGKARVAFDAKKVDSNKLIAAISQVGYTARVEQAS